MTKKVAVLGGGVAGLTAAHELIERGFEVHVYEPRGVPGGKARSIPVPGSGTGGRPDFPGEHGFRFFPGFYKHIPDTMRRIPVAGQPNGVFDNLVQASQYLIAAEPDKDLAFLVKFPTTPEQLLELLVTFFNARKLEIPLGELLFFAGRLLVILSSSQERRLAEFEKIDWWTFVDAEHKSEAYQTFCARGLTRSLVAMRAEIASTRTVGDILLQLLLDVYDPFVKFDRVLNGPTTEVWIKPWVEYLSAKGVHLHYEQGLTEIGMLDGRVSRVKVTPTAGGPSTDVIADYYVMAMPVDMFAPLVTPQMVTQAPALGRLASLDVAWMNGIQFYLRTDQPFAKGHILFAKSPWALTAVSQHQFFHRPITDYGDGTARGILSIDISNWEAPGVLPPYTTAMNATSKDAIKAEVLAQMKMALGPSFADSIADPNIREYFLDPDILFPGPSKANVNLEPLLINTIDSWVNRPDAVTDIPNLFLASDYVRTNTDLATMEGANEAARRAVNGILAMSESSAEPCKVFPLHEPDVFAPARLLDLERLRRDLPHEGISAAEMARMREESECRKATAGKVAGVVGAARAAVHTVSDVIAMRKPS